MKIPHQVVKDYFISTFILSVFLIFIVKYTEAPLAVTCEAGGPYAKNATINVIGNVTNNSIGTVSNVSTNMTLAGSQLSVSNTTSDDDGRYQTSFFLNLDFDTYTMVVSAQANTTTVYCTDTVQVQLGVNTSCENRVIKFQGVAFYSSNSTPITTGTATIGIAEERIANSSSMNSTGGFLVPVTACLKKGGKYTLNVFVDDSYNKRSFLQQIFVAP